MYRSAPTSSPLLVVTHGNRVVAHDRHTGAAVWELVTNEQNRAHCGVRTTITGDRVIVASAGPIQGSWTADAPAMITCLDYATGTPLWERSIDAGLNVGHVSPTVLIDGGQVLVTTGHRVCAFALADGTPQWQAPMRSEAHESIPAGLALPDLTVHADRR